MKTTSVMIQSLCVLCFNRCRYCLLSWNGMEVGAAWDRSVRLSRRFLKEIGEKRPGTAAYLTFGYSMEHPDLSGAIRTLRTMGGPMAEMLQCDGMKMRNDAECGALMEMLREEGIKRLSFTVYGLAEYHDSFAGRQGDHALLLRMMNAAKEAGIPFSTGVPLTAENVGQAEKVIDGLRSAGSAEIRLFIPQEEGRGRNLRGIRLRRQDLAQLSTDARRLLNPEVYRTEEAWLQAPDPLRQEKRQIIISLRQDNIADYEGRSAESVIEEIERLDESYYAAFPDFRSLAEMYGDLKGEKLYRIRDLYHHYRSAFQKEHGIRIYDVTDERQSGSRRF